jgi:predicted PurR-regulated permease PerM
MAHRNATSNPVDRAATVFVGLAVAGCLYVGRDVLLPLALAVLLAFLVAPAVSLVERRGFGRIPSVLIIGLLVAAFVAILATTATTQIAALSEDLPEYRANVEEKFDRFRGHVGRRVESVLAIVRGLKSPATSTKTPPETQASQDEKVAKKITNPGSEEPPPKAAVANGGAEETPVPVAVVDESLSPLELLRDWLGPILSPLATAGIVTVFTVFILVQREDLRNRLIVLLGADRLLGTTKILDEAAQRVSRYLRTQLLLNASYGAAVATCLFVVGMPNALLWGFLAGVLRFVPFIGPLVGATMPVLISLAVFDGWTRPLVIVGLFVAIELVWNNVLEPLMYGASSGLSAIGVLVSAFFWAWLWGAAGLILATPLSACIVVLARHFPQFRFLDLLLGDRPPIPQEAIVYQRLLAEDQEEVAEIVETHLKDHSVASLFDDLLLPALSLAEIDRHSGQLDTEQSDFVQRELRVVVADVVDQIDVDSDPEDLTQAPSPIKVLCVPARDPADELAAEMLAELLRRQGHMAEVVSHHALSGEMSKRFDDGQFDLAIISALPPVAVTHARYRCARFRAVGDNQRIVLGLWQKSDISAKLRDRMRARGADKIVTSISEALSLVELESPGLSSARSLKQNEAMQNNAFANAVGPSQAS